MSNAINLRAKKAKDHYGEAGINIITHASSALERLIPYLLVKWKKIDPTELKSPSIARVGKGRKQIKIQIPFQEINAGYEAIVERKPVPKAVKGSFATMSQEEHTICREFATILYEVISSNSLKNGLYKQISYGFDEEVISRSIKSDTGFNCDIGGIFKELHKITEQTYENKSLTFGIVISEKYPDYEGKLSFPSDFFEKKKYKLLSDGFNTTYVLNPKGYLYSLEEIREGKEKHGKHYYPEWLAHLAQKSKGKSIGIGLTKAGDIVVTQGGSLKYTYHAGGWRYWNHRYYVQYLRGMAKAKGWTSNKQLGSVLTAIYRASLNISFRKTGGLFLVLKNKKDKYKVVRRGDAINDAKRDDLDNILDRSLPGKTIQKIQTSVISELAGIDGAIVVTREGSLLAYGAILDSSLKKGIKGTEGSRTKAAIKASHFGLAVKISSDGDIDAYSDSDNLLTI